jgi:hypothetical protein
MQQVQLTRIPCFLEFANHSEFVPPDWHLDVKSRIIAELLPKFECLANHFARLEQNLNVSITAAGIARGKKGPLFCSTAARARMTGRCPGLMCCT